MMKRRVLAAALSAALFLSLTACGGGNNGGSSSNPGSSSSQGDGSQPDESSSAVIGSASGNVILGPAGGSASSAGGGGADASEPDTGSGSSGGGASSAGGTAEIKLTLNRTNIELNKAGATFKLRYTVDPDIYDGLAVYTSSDTKVATVDDSGTVKAVAPGKATITVKYDSATATASVNCNWTESKPEETKPEENKPGDTSKPAENKPGDTSKPEENKPDDTSKPAEPPAASHVDLSAFYSTITGKYEFAMLELADDGLLDNFYAGMTGISTEQRLIYICGMTMNNGEIGLVQVKDSKDVAAVKNIFQARIDAQAAGGAWYPQAVETWTNNARVVSNGNYVMMVVHENCDDIVKAFNDLF